MRWTAAMSASRDLIARCVIGRVTAAQMHVSGFADWTPWPWLASPHLDVLYHSIHYLDSVRWILGDPAWITSIHGRVPGQSAVEGETMTTTMLEYEDGPGVLVAMNHADVHGVTMNAFRFSGTEGALDGTIADEYDAVPDRCDTLTLRRSGSSPVRVIVTGAPGGKMAVSKSIRSPLMAFSIQVRRVPGPLSAVLLTVQEIGVDIEVVPDTSWL